MAHGQVWLDRTDPRGAVPANRPKQPDARPVEALLAQPGDLRCHRFEVTPDHPRVLQIRPSIMTLASFGVAATAFLDEAAHVRSGRRAGTPAETSASWMKGRRRPNVRLRSLPLDGNGAASRRGDMDVSR